VLEAFEVADAHDVVPFGFADGGQGFAVGGFIVLGAEDGDIDFVTAYGGRVVDGAGGDAGGVTTVRSGGGVPAGPFEKGWAG
jgi:hypothetical protein